MNKLKLTIIGILAAIGANATLIDLGQTTGQPAGQTAEYSRLLQQVNTYNAANNPDLPLPDNSLYSTTPTPTSPKNLSLDLTGYSGYLMLKWGDKNQFYYVTNETSYEFVSNVLNIRGTSYLGLSHYNTWIQTDEPPKNNVSDDINSISSISFGVLGIAILHNIKKRKI